MEQVKTVVRAWDRVEDIPAGVKTVDVLGDPVIGGHPSMTDKLRDYLNRFAPFVEVEGGEA